MEASLSLLCNLWAFKFEQTTAKLVRLDGDSNSVHLSTKLIKSLFESVAPLSLTNTQDLTNRTICNLITLKAIKVNGRLFKDFVRREWEQLSPFHRRKLSHCRVVARSLVRTISRHIRIIKRRRWWRRRKQITLEAAFAFMCGCLRSFLVSEH